MMNLGKFGLIDFRVKSILQNVQQIHQICGTFSLETPITL